MTVLNVLSYGLPDETKSHLLLVSESLGYCCLEASNESEALNVLTNNEICACVFGGERDSLRVANCIHQKNKHEGLAILFVVPHEQEVIDNIENNIVGLYDFIFLPFQERLLQNKLKIIIEYYFKDNHRCRDDFVENHDLPPVLLPSIDNLGMSEFNRTVEFVKDSIFTLSCDGKIQYANTVALAMLGENLSDIHGGIISDHLSLFYQGNEMPIIDIINHVVDEQTITYFPRETQLKNVEGKRFVVEGTVSCVMDGTHKVNGIILCFHDILNEIKLERAVNHAKKVRSLSVVLTNLAVAVRDPVSGMIMAGENIARRLKEKNESNNKAAEKAGLSLSQIEDYCKNRNIFKFVEDILLAGKQVSKLVLSLEQLAEEAVVEKSRANLHIILQDAMDKMQKEDLCDFEIKWGDIEFIADIEKNISFVACSATEIIQVICNVFKNSMAAMYNTGRNPRIWIKLYEEDEKVVLGITDNGVGINAQNLNKVINPFYTTKDKRFSLGLGLTVAKSIIEHNHDGRFFINSEVGKGTSVLIALPVKL